MASSFVPPSRQQRLRALDWGAGRQLHASAQLIFSEAGTFEPSTPAHQHANSNSKGQQKERAFFDPIPVPDEDDWLFSRSGAGQSFAKYVSSKPNLPSAGPRNVVYLMPLVQASTTTSSAPQSDEKKEHIEAAPEALLAYAQAFFHGMTVKLLPERTLAGVKTRINSDTKAPQWYVPDIFSLLKRALPADAYCLCGMTNVDLYPHPDWNYVFGKAAIKARIGVFSFHRHNPAFHGQRQEHHQLPFQQILLRRSCKTLTHEVCHQFGIKHCVYYSCLMNGSNTIEEADSKPPQLCPVCLRKLQHTIGFSPLQRYERLVAILESSDVWMKKGAVPTGAASSSGAAYPVFSLDLQWFKQRLLYLKSIGAKDPAALGKRPGDGGNGGKSGSSRRGSATSAKAQDNKKAISKGSQAVRTGASSTSVPRYMLPRKKE